MKLTFPARNTRISRQMPSFADFVGLRPIPCDSVELTTLCYSRACSESLRHAAFTSRPGKLTDNAFIESFNGRLREECLNQHWFSSLDEARRLTKAGREDYNRVRPHGALGHRTPLEFARNSAGHAPLNSQVR